MHYHKKKQGLLSILSLALLFSAPNVLACKMTALGASTQAMDTVMNQLAADTARSDWSITRIRQTLVYPLTYSVKAEKGKTDCQLIHYVVTVNPDCSMTAQPTGDWLLCGRNKKS